MQKKEKKDDKILKETKKDLESVVKNLEQRDDQKKVRREKSAI